MARKYGTYSYKLKRFRNQFRQSIEEPLMRMGKEISELGAKYFAKRAKDYLMQRATPKDSASMQKIIDIRDSITVVPDRYYTGYNTTKNIPVALKGYAVKIPKDPDGLFLYLEYGTGLEGQSNPHPEASSIGWAYAINDNTTRMKKTRNRTFENSWYPTITVDGIDKTGFVFRNKGAYLDRADKIFRNSYNQTREVEEKIREFVKEVYVPPTPMHSKYGKAFTRPEYTYKKYRTMVIKRSVIEQKFSDKEFVISSGLKPVRYIYSAKQDLMNIIASSINIGEVREKLTSKL